MKDLTTAFESGLKNLDRASWLERVDEISEEFGYFEPISPDHSSFLIDGNKTLIVSFESTDIIRSNNTNSAPLGWEFASKHGWSSLTIMAEKSQDWYRHPGVIAYFDRVIDDGFFDDFDQVLFYGSGAAGYAAAAFSIAAPSARVLTIQPHSTLNTALSRWDRRFPSTRRLDFCSRFGFAPDMLETATQVVVVHDPSIIEDAMHAQMFSGANTMHLTCPYIGPEAAQHFRRMRILALLIESTMNGTLTPAGYAKAWRVRQRYLPYLRTLFFRLEQNERHPRLLARLCRQIEGNGRRPMFADKLAELEAQGVKL